MRFYFLLQIVNFPTLIFCILIYFGLFFIYYYYLFI